MLRHAACALVPADLAGGPGLAAGVAAIARQVQTLNSYVAKKFGQASPAPLGPPNAAASAQAPAAANGAATAAAAAGAAASQLPVLPPAILAAAQGNGGVVPPQQRVSGSRAEVHGDLPEEKGRRVRAPPCRLPSPCLENKRIAAVADRRRCCCCCCRGCRCWSS